MSIHNKVGADIVLSLMKTLGYGLLLLSAGQVLIGSLATIAKGKKEIDLVKQNTILASNNTPPASRKISAPRGVTCF